MVGAAGRQWQGQGFEGGHGLECAQVRDKEVWAVL